MKLPLSLAIIPCVICVVLSSDQTQAQNISTTPQESTPQIAKTPSFNEQAFAAKLIVNAANQAEQIHNQGMAQSLRQQQKQTALAKLQAEQAEQELNLYKYAQKTQAFKQETDALRSKLQASPEQEAQQQWLAKLKVSAIIPLASGEYKALLNSPDGRLTAKNDRTLKGDISVQQVFKNGVTLTLFEKSHYLYIN